MPDLQSQEGTVRAVYLISLKPGLKITAIIKIPPFPERGTMVRISVRHIRGSSPCTLISPDYNHWQAVMRAGDICKKFVLFSAGCGNFLVYSPSFWRASY
jgi:hypothetical protein